MTKKQLWREVIEVHDEAVFALENGITLNQLRDLIRTLGNDRETLDRAVRSLLSDDPQGDVLQWPIRKGL